MEITRPFTKNPLPEKFWNRKQFYSINCIMICDHMKRIRFFTNRHAGSAHDSRIWEESQMKQTLTLRNPQNLQYLIGDEGFSCTDTLLTVVRSAALDKLTDQRKIAQVKAYNSALKKARVRVEQCFGMMKKRFPALLYQLRCRKIENVQAIISSCVVLHNFLLKDGDPVMNVPEAEFRAQLARTNVQWISNSTRGQYKVRDHVIQSFF